jgi:thioredoxin reductase
MGDSGNWRGTTGVVPPPPIPENAIARFTDQFQVGVPLIATSRVVDPEAADRLVAEGKADVVGMTRAMITDPAMPEKIRRGRRNEADRCLGCNVCISHYHDGLPITCAMNPRTGREAVLPPPEPVGDPDSYLVVGGGPAGLAAAAELGALGKSVTLLESRERLGGQIALTRDAPGTGEIARTLTANFEAKLAGVDVRLGFEGTPDSIAALARESGARTVIVATGAVPYRPPTQLSGVEVVQAFDFLERRDHSLSGRAVIADWGGDSSGMDAAELLAASGADVTLVSSSVSLGDELQQYRRNLYLERLYAAGIRIEQHLELTGAADGEVSFRNIFDPGTTLTLGADLLILGLGRVPVDALGPLLASRGLEIVEAGDCRSPRTLEEAILEGTMAARQAAGLDALGFELALPVRS